MKKIITFLLFAALALNLFAQYANDQVNLEKYWLYRQRLRENFIFSSNINYPGSNIPVSRIVPDKTKSFSGAIGPVSTVDWDDCNGALPYYIMLLATEYSLLKKYPSNPTAININAASTALYELKNAIKAVQRLDEFADGVLNGVFRRSDICQLKDRVNSTVKTEYRPLVTHFDQKASTDDLIKFTFREEIEDKGDNATLARYNSFDNVLKFIEAERVVSKVLSPYTFESSDVVDIMVDLGNLVRRMIEQMYHPSEPRKWSNRNEIANTLSFMKQTWYLKDPDKLYLNPDGLLATENGGGADEYTYATSYGFAKSANRFLLDYNGTQFSSGLFEKCMRLASNSRLDFVKTSFERCDPVNSIELVDESGIYSTLKLYDGIRWFWYCNETQREVVSYPLESPASFWMIRTLAALNDISPQYTSTYEYLVALQSNNPKPLEHLALIWSILYNKSQISNTDRAYIGGLLNAAPRCGPYNIELQNGSFTYQSLEWSCPNRFIWPELNGPNGPNDRWRSGYYNGIDYMVLHNLYWLTKVTASEYSSTYIDYLVENQVKNISNKSIHAYAKYSVKLRPGFKVTGNPTYKYIAGIDPDMRTAYDPYFPYTYQYVNYNTECDPIFKEDNLKSASIATNVQAKSLDQTNVTVYPNPSNEVLTVSSNEIIQNIEVLNANGKIQFEFINLNIKSHTFNLAGLSPGLYMVKTITINGYEQMEKIIKKE